MWFRINTSICGNASFCRSNVNTGINQKELAAIVSTRYSTVAGSTIQSCRPYKELNTKARQKKTISSPFPPPISLSLSLFRFRDEFTFNVQVQFCSSSRGWRKSWIFAICSPSHCQFKWHPSHVLTFFLHLTPWRRAAKRSATLHRSLTANGPETQLETRSRFWVNFCLFVVSTHLFVFRGNQEGHPQWLDRFRPLLMPIWRDGRHLLWD